MESTSTAEPLSAMEETPNWLEMPPELMAMILQRLGVLEILNNVQKVCTTWRKICKDPAMWKVINMLESFDVWSVDDNLENLTKQAVHRSCGELIDISLECYCTDDLLDHISRCSSNLKRLCLSNCYNVTSRGLSHAVKKLPQLEQLHLYYTTLYVEEIEVIGRNCPRLTSFKLNKEWRSRSGIECDGDALAIANSMPELRHLQLFGNQMTDEGLQAILHGCPHLESLDVRRCLNLNLAGNLGKLCKERVKDFKFPNDSTKNCGFDPRIHAYDDINDMYSSGYSDMDDYSDVGIYEDYEFSGGSAVSEEDDYDFFYND